MPHEDIQNNSASSENKPAEQMPNDGKQEFDVHVECASLVRNICGQYDLVVTTDLDPAMAQPGQDPNQIWFAKYKIDKKTGKPLPEFEYVRIPEVIRARRKEFAFGAASHEGAHVISTRTAVIPEKYAKTLGFSGLMAAIEELPTDELVRERLPAGEAWINITRRELAIDGILQIQDSVNALKQQATASEERLSQQDSEDRAEDVTEIEKEEAEEDEVFGKEKILEERKVNLTEIAILKNKIPTSRYQDFCTLVVFEQHHTPEEIEALFHPDAVEALREVIDEVIDVEQLIPDKDADEKTIIAKQTKRAQITYKKILSKALELIEKDSEEKKQEMMRQKEAREKLEESDEPDEIKQGIEKILDDLDKLSQKQIENEIKKAKIATSDLPEEEKKAQMDEIQKQIDATNKEKTDKQKQLWDMLPDWLKELLEKMAERAMQDIEDAIIKEHGGKFTPTSIKTHEERRSENEIDNERKQDEEEQKRKREEEQKKQQDEENKKIKDEKIREEEKKKLKEKVEKMKQGKSLYEKMYVNVREVEEKLYAELDEALFPNTSSQTTHKTTGHQPNRARVFKRTSQKKAGSAVVEDKIFETITRPERKDYAIMILVDLSGSMGQNGSKQREWMQDDVLGHVDVHSKIMNTIKAVIVLTEVLQRLGISFSVYGFQDKILPFKVFEEELRQETRDNMSSMVYEVYERNPGGNNDATNADGEAVADVSEILEKQPQQEKIIIVMSDGQPADTGRRARALGIRSSRKHLHYEVNRILRETDQKMIGLGLGAGTTHVKDYYPIALPNLDLEHLPEELAKILKTILLDPDVLAQAAQDMKESTDTTELDDDEDDDWY